MSRRRWWLFAAVEAALLVTVPVLAWVGFDAVLDTTAGRTVDPELDPDEPGYEAFLDSTPVALVVGTDEERALSWLAVLALGGAGEEGGSVVFVPPATVVDHPELGDLTLRAAWADGGRDRLVTAVGGLLRAGFGEVIVLDPPRIAELFGPLSPLSIRLSDELPGFDVGDVEVPAEDIPALLAVTARGESDLARMARHEDLWRAWLAAVSASDDPDVVPGEAATGIGRFVRGLAAGPTSFDVIPVTPEEDDDGEEVFDADADDVAALVSERIPFPVGPWPGARPRVRVLDAVGADGLALRVARDTVRAGAQVVVLGNADRFGAEASRVVYFDAGLTRSAEQIGEALAVDRVERLDGPNPNDLVDVTVVVGTDLLEAYGLEERPTAGGDDAG